MIDIVYGAILVAVVVLVLVRYSRSENDMPDEPWLEWDGVIPDEVDAPPRVLGAWDPAKYPGAIEIARQRPAA